MEILARLRAARQSESEGGRREHGVTVVGGAGRWTGALDGAYLRITNYDLENSAPLAQSSGADAQRNFGYESA